MFLLRCRSGASVLQNAHPDKMKVAIVVVRRCFICFQFLIFDPFCSPAFRGTARLVCGWFGGKYSVTCRRTVH